MQNNAERLHTDNFDATSAHLQINNNNNNNYAFQLMMS